MTGVQTCALPIFHIIEDLDPAAIIAGLREAGLPNIWIPKVDDFVKIDALPLLGSGKLDLLALKKLVQQLEN